MEEHIGVVDPVTRALHDAETALGRDPRLAEVLAGIARAARWGDAAARLSMSIQPPIDVNRARQLVADEARRATGARAVTIGTREEQPVAGVSADPDQLDLYRRLTHALSTQVPYRIEEVLERRLEGHCVVLAPMRAHLAGRGAVIAWYDDPPTPTQLLDRDHLAAFAEQAGLCLDRAQAVEDRADLAVVSDRERIARDLHDVVIQRIFATGLQLQAVAPMLTDEALTAKVEAAVDALDLTIRDIRRTIFELQHRGTGSLRAQVRELIREYVGVLGHTPTLRTTGPIDTGVPERVRDHMLSVLREALSNVARHADASCTEISVAVARSEVGLTVCDDGLGPGSTTRESGLANARRRAEELGGTFTVGPRKPRGTVLHWTAPTD